jgi:hypothetical protein
MYQRKLTLCCSGKTLMQLLKEINFLELVKKQNLMCLFWIFKSRSPTEQSYFIYAFKITTNSHSEFTSHVHSYQQVL